MSRAAASLAATLNDYESEPKVRRPQSATEKYRLLGQNQRRVTTTQVARKHIWVVDANVRDERDYQAFAVQPALEDARVTRRLPVWRILAGLTVTVVGIVLLGFVVSPVLAREASSQGLRVRLSGYSELSGQVAPQGVLPPVVDVSTEAQPAPQPEPAANPAPPAPPTGSYEVTAPPSLSVQQIERVLQQYGSPAAGKGQALFDLGVRYGIDPAYALAFFVHESSCGTKGVARFTHSLGNIRWTEGFENYEGYRKYANWETGIEDWYKLISNLYIGGWGLRTVDAIIPVYAPWGDNNHPPTYIASVKRMVDDWRGK